MIHRQNTIQNKNVKYKYGYENSVIKNDLKVISFHFLKSYFKGASGNPWYDQEEKWMSEMEEPNLTSSTLPVSAQSLED